MKGLAGLLPALLLLTSCAGLAPATPATDSDRDAYAAAVQLLRRSPEEGRARLHAFLRERSRSSLADDAAVALAEHHLGRGETDQALQPLVFAVRRHPRGDRTDLARLWLAGIQRERGHLEAAWRTASAIHLDVLRRDQRQAAERLLADLAAERGDRVARLLWLARTREAEGDADARARIDEELAGVIGRMESDELVRAAEELGSREPAAAVTLRWAELAIVAGDTETARRALARARTLPLSAPAAEQLALLEGRLGRAARGASGRVVRLPGPGELPPPPLPDPAGLSGTLGVVLPLSGPYAVYGEECLQGILLATGMFGPRGPTPGGLELLVRDSRGTAEGAEAAVRELAGRRDVLAILGPLLGAEAEAAAAVAEAEHVPLLALSRREEVALDRPYVFRLGLTPAHEVALLADYALRQLGVTKVAILHPKDDYGVRLRDLFWNAVESGGGSVVGAAGYDVEATDFAGPIRSLLGFDLLTPGQTAALARRGRLLDQAKRSTREKAAELRAQAAGLRSPDGEPLPPFVDFEALFIPDSYDRVALIAPQLAFHEVRGVRLLGTSGWHHPDLVEIGRKHVDGAVFTSAFFPGSRLPAVRDFSSRFEATFGRPAESLAAEAHDAAVLLLDQLALHPTTDRRALRDGLLTVDAMGGVSGVVSVGSDGNADKRSYLLGVQRGRIVSLDETGKPPYLRGAPARARD